jgi:hypothetical protein
LTSTSLDKFPRNTHKQLGERKASINPRQPPVITMVSLGTFCSARHAPDIMSYNLYTPPEANPVAVYQTAKPAAVVCSPCTLNPTSGSDTQSNLDSTTLLRFCDLYPTQLLSEIIIIIIIIIIITAMKSSQVFSNVNI